MTSAGTSLALLGAIDGLYESVVSDPAAWREQAFADWASDALGDLGPLPRPFAREVRRAIRASQRLQRFWADQPVACDGSGGFDPGEPTSVEADWRARVDAALGARAWRPSLAIAQIGLDLDPSPALFDEVKRRFPLVHFERWMDGLTYDEWVAGNSHPA